jgi:hypothetical protein
MSLSAGYLAPSAACLFGCLVQVVETTFGVLVGQLWVDVVHGDSFASEGVMVVKVRGCAGRSARYRRPGGPEGPAIEVGAFRFVTGAGVPAFQAVTVAGPPLRPPPCEFPAAQANGTARRSVNSIFNIVCPPFVCSSRAVVMILDRCTLIQMSFRRGVGTSPF